MSKLLSIIALAFMMIFVPLAPASASAPTTDTVACIHEDGSGQDEACYWDGGDNGQGDTYIIHEDDSVTMLTTDTTPAAPVATLEDHEAYAWMLFDAVDAASLLPAEGGEVTLIGFNSTGFPNLTADLITVWDMQGNHYLFQVG